MIFRVPIRYTVTGIKEGNARPGTCAVFELVEVDIPVIDEVEAPIAVEWNDHSIESLDTVWGRTTESGERHTRFHSGKHYQFEEGRVSDARLDIPIAALSCDQLSECLNSFSWAPNPFKMIHPSVLEMKQQRKHPQPLATMFTSVDRTDRETAFSDVERIARNLIIVDELLYSVTSEPTVVMFRTSVSMWTLKITTDPMAFERNKSRLSPTGLRMFPIDEFGKALTASRRANARLESHDKDYFLAANERRRPVIGDHFLANRDTNHAVGLKWKLDGLIERLAPLIGSLWSTSMLRAWCDVRDGADMIDTPDGQALAERGLSVLFQAFVQFGGASNEHAIAVREVLNLLGDAPISLEMDMETILSHQR
jgi:hypothetical protein